MAEHRAAHDGHGERAGDRRADPHDRRFKDDAWQENEVFDFIKQSYLLSARYVQDVVTQVDGLDAEDRAEGGFLRAPVRRCDEPVATSC